MKREINLQDLVEKICEMDGFFRAYFGKSYHDYKQELKDLKSILKREIEKWDK